MKGKYRLLLAFSTIVLLIVVFSQCMRGHGESSDPRGNEYAGAETCKKCHAGIADSYAHTPHRQTTMLASAGELEKLHSSSGKFMYNDSLEVRIEKRDSGMYQVAYLDGKPVRAHRFDLVIGSGEKAHSFGYWQGNRLFQLPLSYFRQINDWANSPGYVSDQPYFDRVILSRCLECHSSFIDKKMVPDGNLKVAEELDQRSFVAGIDCERCHGPAKAHVDFHVDHPAEKKAKYMISYRSLTRARRLETCAVCHSGNDQETELSTFDFRPGDTLSRFYVPQFGAPPSGEPDVHGKQLQMLSASACFRAAKTMDCLSCHNTHAKESNNLAAYSQKCMSCHNSAAHPKIGMPGITLQKNCIDCHMPLQPSKVITFRTAGKSQATPYLLRTHRIAIYREALF